jgi:hypothetical protein
MGVSYTVSFHRDFRSPEHQKRVAAVRALAAVGVEVLPKELADYFGTARVAGVDLEEEQLQAFSASVEAAWEHQRHPAVTRDEDGCTIDLRKLPPDIAFIRARIG